VASGAAASYLNRQAAAEFRDGREWLVEVTFDEGAQRRSADLRPGLPLVLRW
jgi:hypothetical protein